ncbi:MAG: tRNA (guanosine(37)-N1)-methyltransferase TrmD [Planctomycetes bacterium]|nr:tRNA (guanosine(37)-N1)-methyltransferase TrmD [Planctomycetota bacterium]
MRIDVLTIFPEMFDTFLRTGMVERARRAGALEVHTTDLRAFTSDRHRSVDDRPYGGGPGMLLKPEPVQRAMELLGADYDGTRAGECAAPKRALLLLCPQGERLRQETLDDLAVHERLVLACGRYEGFDQRILEAFPWRRISIGDYVLSGGEVPAMVLIEGVARLLPGVLGHPESAARDSFSEWAGERRYDHPHFTRPPVYRGRGVPDVLRSGDHAEIESWRREEAKKAATNTLHAAPLLGAAIEGERREARDGSKYK